jgi:hypothetical protein
VARNGPPRIDPALANQIGVKRPTREPSTSLSDPQSATRTYLVQVREVKVMLFVIGGELRDVHFPPAIKDDDWPEIERLSGLPPKARSELDEYIGFCRQLRNDATLKYHDRWFKALSAVIQAEEESKKRLVS